MLYLHSYFNASAGSIFAASLILLTTDKDNNSKRKPLFEG